MIGRGLVDGREGREGTMTTTYQQAEAELAHLKPKHDAVEFGVLCAAGTGMLLAVFCWLAGLDLNRFGLPGGAIILIAFLAPWFYYRDQQRRYAAALMKRWDELEGRRTAARP